MSAGKPAADGTGAERAAGERPAEESARLAATELDERDPEGPPDPTPRPHAGIATAEAARPGGERTGRYAALVALGILLSRVFGFVRSGVFARYFGTGMAADAYNAAMRIPNFLQNLFGEGVLSASFIPVYAGLLARGEREEADRVAGAVGSLLAVVVAVLVALGMLATPLLVGVVAPGFDDATRELTIRLVRIAFPGIGLLVGSAWCLGILNSHRRFLLSYVAPVAWNVAIVATLLWFGRTVHDLARLATIVAWGAVAGSALQFLVQVPTVVRLAPRLRAGFALDSPQVRKVLRNFAPVLVGRGVVQISGYVDNSLASLVASGAVTVFTNAQMLYLLPGSLFGASISAAALPAMSSVHGAHDDVAARLRTMLATNLRRIAFFVVPSAAAFLAIGDVLAGAVFGYGRFTRADVVWVWGTLAGASLGLLPSTLGRLYSSAFYALHDTRTPLRFAVLRVALTLGLGYVAAVHLPPALGLDARWGTAGLTLASGLAAWMEFALLRHGLGRRIGRTGVPGASLARIGFAAAVAAAAGWLAKALTATATATAALPPLVLAVVAGTVFGATYLAIASALGEGEAATLVARVRGRLSGARRAR